jgi:DNA ligase 1
MSNFKPLLSGKADLTQIKYPVLATPKLDGIRCVIHEGEAKSRNLKPIPNVHIRKTLAGLISLDGELMVNGDFNVVQGDVMRESGTPDFTYNVFDEFTNPDHPYSARIGALRTTPLPSEIKIISPLLINNETELLQQLDTYLDQGYEGLMFRAPDGKYKFGRSTVNEGILLKVKKFLDDEAELIGITEKMTNHNPKVKDKLGRSQRSSHKANKTPAGTAGSLTVRWQGHEFKIGFGPGFNDVVKKELWDNRNTHINKMVTFSYQELSAKGIPRFGKLIGFRHKDDIS